MGEIKKTVIRTLSNHKLPFTVKGMSGKLAKRQLHKKLRRLSKTLSREIEDE